MENVKHESSKVYIYTRVSTAMQVDGFSLDAQKEEIMRYVQYKNMHVVGEYTDEGKSGKSIQGRPGFQQMLDDIIEKKDDISFVICFKLSRFGRNTADILNSLKMMKRYGVHLICVKENIDSSLDSGKMMISILGAMAEIERDNISVQTMAGRREKARQGGWNGAKPPYGYTLDSGNIVILPEEAEHIRIIFDKYVNTNLGFKGVARWMNMHGYKKIINTHNGRDIFTDSFVDSVIKNHTYAGKIAYGKRKTVLREGSEDEYHTIETKDYNVYEGQHEAIIDEETWGAAQAKVLENGGRKEVIDKDHTYIFSALVKCPICGKSLYGVPMRRKKKDGTWYPTYYAYGCRSNIHYNGIKCGYGQISCSIIDSAMYGIISNIVNADNFGDVMSELVGEQIDTKELEQELDTAIKAQRQALGLQRKLESELDCLDVMDKHYDRKYESLSRRLDDVFDTIEESEKRVADCEARIESVKKQGLSKDSIYESLKLFNQLFDKMNDHEKKAFVNTFIESIELYPDKKRKDGCAIKTVHFKFPVAYNGEAVYDVLSPLATTDETVVLLSDKKVDSHVSIDLDVEKLEGKSGTATYAEIKAYVEEKHGMKVSSLYIGQIKNKMGLEKRKNYNIGSGEGRVPTCPAEKEEAIVEAFKHFNLI